jgi:hypothetical protein
MRLAVTNRAVPLKIFAGGRTQLQLAHVVIRNVLPKLD